MEEDRKRSICSKVVQVCPICEVDPTNVHIVVEVNDEIRNLQLLEQLYTLYEISFAENIKQFLKTIPAIECKVQVTVARRTDVDVSDIFANMNLTNELASDREVSNRISSDRFSSFDASTSNDDYSSTSSSDAGLSNENYFNSGSFDASISNVDPDNSDAGPSVVITNETLVNYLVFLLHESKSYPMIIFYPDNSGIYYPVYSVDHKLFFE